MAILFPIQVISFIFKIKYYCGFVKYMKIVFITISSFFLMNEYKVIIVNEPTSCLLKCKIIFFSQPFIYIHKVIFKGNKFEEKWQINGSYSHLQIDN